MTYLDAVGSVRLVCPLESRGQAQRAAPQTLEQAKMENNADIHGWVSTRCNGLYPATYSTY